MRMSELQYISSANDTALAQNAILRESINLPADWITAGVQEILIEGISLQMDEDIAMEIMIFNSANAVSTTLTVDPMVDSVAFAATGLQIAGAGQRYYPSPLTLAIPYRDLDNSGKLHYAMICRDAAGKTAGATGSGKVTFAIRPVRGV